MKFAASNESKERLGHVLQGVTCPGKDDRLGVPACLWSYRP